MNEKRIDGELTVFKYDRTFQEWTATFTERELRSFVKRIRKRAKKECGSE